MDNTALATYKATITVDYSEVISTDFIAEQPKKFADELVKDALTRVLGSTAKIKIDSSLDIKNID